MSAHQDASPNYPPSAKAWNGYGIRYDQTVARKRARGAMRCECGTPTNEETEPACVICQVESRAGARLANAGHSPIEILAERKLRQMSAKSAQKTRSPHAA